MSTLMSRKLKRKSRKCRSDLVAEEVILIERDISISHSPHGLLTGNLLGNLSGHLRAIFSHYQSEARSLFNQRASRALLCRSRAHFLCMRPDTLRKKDSRLSRWPRKYLDCNHLHTRLQSFTYEIARRTPVCLDGLASTWCEWEGQAAWV